jgi:hypothetical protein
MSEQSYEVIFAIVNAGFAEEAMEVARANGARGGTILGARGVAREKEAAFFGITLHADKEILMLVVEKSIRDNILNALYKEMGMDKKAQGITFSLPVSDVAGLAAPQPEQEKK